MFSVTSPGSLVSCYYCALTLQNLKDSDCIYTKHDEYNPYCIHLVQKAPKFLIDDKWFTVLLWVLKSYLKCSIVYMLRGPSLYPTIGQHAVLALCLSHPSIPVSYSKEGKGKFRNKYVFLFPFLQSLLSRIRAICFLYINACHVSRTKTIPTYVSVNNVTQNVACYALSRRKSVSVLFT